MVPNPYNSYLRYHLLNSHGYELYGEEEEKKYAKKIIK